jgi:hypothetical protein
MVRVDGLIIKIWRAHPSDMPRPCLLVLVLLLALPAGAFEIVAFCPDPYLSGDPEIGRASCRERVSSPV